MWLNQKIVKEWDWMGWVVRKEGGVERKKTLFRSIFSSLNFITLIHRVSFIVLAFYTTVFIFLPHFFFTTYKVSSITNNSFNVHDERIKSTREEFILSLNISMYVGES